MHIAGVQRARDCGDGRGGQPNQELLDQRWAGDETRSWGFF